MSERVPDSFLHSLAIAALEPSLQQVLLFDADFKLLETAVSLLQQLLALITKQSVHTVSLTDLAQDDDLWGSYVPASNLSSESDGTAGLNITWQDGWLTQNRNDESWLLVVVPDLTRLSLAASRACIILLDTPVTHLERHSQQMPWHPRIFWLAACARDDVGKISPHLLDRFSLRLTVPSLQPNPTSSVANILQWLQNSEAVTGQFSRQTPLPDGWDEKVAQPRPRPPVSLPAIQQVIAYTANSMHPGVRRELALARLGQMIAWWENGSMVGPQHIDEAAQLIGLKLPQASVTTDENETLNPLQPEQMFSQLESDLQPSQLSEPTPTSSSELTPVNESEEPEIMPLSFLPQATPYPEDDAPIDREIFTLQLPLHRQRAISSEHGVIIGTQAADSLHDIALVPTILEAALYQKIRRKYQPNANGLILSPSDLQRFRRVPQPEKLLLLMLDYTSLHDCEWQLALLPHLQWAYVSRANITIIKVGSANAEHELRAQKVVARSLLTPHIAESLEMQPGQATPLAHGLEMAYQVLQQSRSIIQETRFVLITDGRGNVPLTASINGRVTTPVNREGIDDALLAAKHFRGMKQLNTFLLDPQPAYHAELPLSLAESLGAKHQTIPLVPEAQL